MMSNVNVPIISFSTEQQEQITGQNVVELLQQQRRARIFEFDDPEPRPEFTEQIDERNEI